MKLAATIARYLMGIMFTVFGLNGFFHFLPQPPPPEQLAVQYFTVLIASHYMVVPFLLQLTGGVLLLANRYVPFALTILAPVIVNILLFHILMSPGGLPLGLLAAILWLIVFFAVRQAFAGIFQAKTPAVA